MSSEADPERALAALSPQPAPPNSTQGDSSERAGSFPDAADGGRAERALQAMVDDAQAMGLYDDPPPPHPKTALANRCESLNAAPSTPSRRTGSRPTCRLASRTGFFGAPSWPASTSQKRSGLCQPAAAPLPLKRGRIAKDPPASLGVREEHESPTLTEIFASAWHVIDKDGRRAATCWTEDQAIAEQAWQDEHNGRFSPHRIEKPAALGVEQAPPLSQEQK